MSQQTRVALRIDPVNIESHMVPVARRQDEREWSYWNPETGRLFNVRASQSTDQKEFFLEEYVPNGRMFEVDDDGKLVSAWDEPAILHAEQSAGPNGFIAAIEAQGLDPQKMVMLGSGYGVDSQYFPNKAEVAQAIALAIEIDQRHSSRRELTPAERAAMAKAAANGSRAYWLAQSVSLSAAMTSESGIFKGCHAMMGSRLDPQSKKDILSYLNAPTQATWNEIRGLCVVGPTTLWQAWTAADPEAPRSGSVGFPKPDAVRSAIRSAVSDRKTECETRLAEFKKDRQLRSVESGPTP